MKKVLRSLFCVVLLLATACLGQGNAQAQVLLANPGPPNNGGSAGWAMFYNLIGGPFPVTITDMTTGSSAAANASFNVEFFVRSGNALGGPVGSGPGSSTDGWTSLGTVPAVQGPTASGVSLLFATPVIEVPAGDTVGVAMMFSSAGPRYFGTGTPPLETYSDGNLTLVTGDVRSIPFTPTGTWFSSRALVGEIHYTAQTATPGWATQMSGISAAINSVKAVSGTIAWAGAAGGVVLRTTDGGTNWTSVGGGAIGTADVYAIEAIDANTAIVTTTPNATFLYRTTDAGATWTQVYTDASTGAFLDAIHMFDATTGIAYGDPVGGNWVILETTDGGTSWARSATQPAQVGTEAGSNNGMAVLGTTHIWFCSNATTPTIYRSTDGGATWAFSALPFSATFTSGISFIDTQNGVVGSNGGQAARTTDGGATWTSITVPGSGAIYGIGSAGMLDYWATRGTSIYHSNDRGSTFALDTALAIGTFNHVSFVNSGSVTYGWAATATGGIVAYYNPVSSHDIGVSGLELVSVTANSNQQLRVASGDAAAAINAETSSEEFSNDESSALSLVNPKSITGYLSPNELVELRALVTNTGSFSESSYQVAWTIDGVAQTPVSNSTPLGVGETDSIMLTWNSTLQGRHTARAWTVLAGDANSSNDTSEVEFQIGILPGDTLYNFTIQSELLLGISKMGSSNKLAITSGGTSNTSTTDNKYIVTTLYGDIIDSSHYQINNTTGQGFGFRDLAFDGTWLLTSDSPQLRRIDTTTFTEVASQITGPGTLQRGLATESPNRIWKSNFTSDPVALFDTTGAVIKSLGTPTVAPYGIAFDKWTDPNRGWLWYAQPSIAGQILLSKVDTATGAIVQSYDYSALFPAAASSGGLDIVNDHPDYPGSVVAFMVTQLGPGGVISAIYLGPDSTTVQPTDSILVVVHDSTLGTSTLKRKADRDTLFQYLNTLLPSYDVAYVDTSGTTLPNLSGYKHIIYQETSFDDAVCRWLGAGSRQAIRNWLNAGTPANRRTFTMIGADLGYNYSRSGSGSRDTVLAQDMLKFVYRVDNGSVSGQTSIVGVSLNSGMQFAFTTTPPGSGFWPDGCTPQPGGVALYRYAGHSELDTVAGVGYQTSGYTAATMFLDPRYFTPNTGFGEVLQAMLQYTNILTDVKPPVAEIPQEFALMQNYPNPFNPSTTISYAIPIAAQVNISIYNVLGQRVAELVHDVQAPGYHNVVWNGRNGNSLQVASGVYFYRLEATPQNGGQPFSSLKKMLLLK